MLTKLFNAERSEEIGGTNEFGLPPNPKLSTVTELSWVCVLSAVVRGNRTLHSCIGGMCSNVLAMDSAALKPRLCQPFTDIC